MQLLRVLPEYSWTTIRLLAAFPDSLDASTCYLRTMPPGPPPSPSQTKCGENVTNAGRLRAGTLLPARRPSSQL